MLFILVLVVTSVFQHVCRRAYNADCFVRYHCCSTPSQSPVAPAVESGSRSMTICRHHFLILSVVCLNGSRSPFACKVNSCRLPAADSALVSSTFATVDLILSSLLSKMYSYWGERGIDCSLVLHSPWQNLLKLRCICPTCARNRYAFGEA